MTQTAILTVGANTATNSVSGNAVNYYGPWAGALFLNSANTTEANAQVKNRGASTLQDAYAQVPSNSRSTTTTITSRVNTAAGNISISIGAGTTGVISDTTHSDSLADGDLYNYKVAMGASAQNLFISGMSAQLVASGQCFKPVFSFASDTTLISVSANHFAAPAGSSLGGTSEGGKQINALESATISNLQIYVGTSNTNNPTVASRINGVNGNQTVTLTASTTGLFEDTTHSDSVVATDLIDIYSGSFNTARTIWLKGYKYLGATTDRSPIWGGGLGTGGSAATNYWPFGYTAKSTTENQTQLPVPAAGTGSGLSVQITVNATGATQSFQFRLNGANGNQVAAISSAASGIFTDSTHTDTLAAGDLVNCSTSSAFNSNVATSSYGFLFAVSSGVVANNAQPLLGVL